MSRATFLLDVAGDPEGSRRAWQRSEQVLAESGDKPSYPSLYRAEYLRKLGDLDAAQEAIRQYLAAASSPWRRFGLGVGDRYTLALLLAEQEEPLPTQTQLLLWSCLNDGPEDERAELARAALAR